jgi:GNAT superfamily N-acetyltransferase
MSRSPVSLREATGADAPFLVELWADVLRKADRQDLLADVEIVIKSAAGSAEQRLVVAEYDGQPAGAVLLRVDTLSAINLEPVLQAVSPHVLPSCRRHGVGWALMDAAVTWAEELGIGHVVTAASAESRGGNRFMARLSLGALAMVRVAATHSVRARLAAQVPTGHRASNRRHLAPLLAARRSQRRAQRTDA